MRHSLLIQQQHVENFSIMLADCGDICPLLSLWSAEYECLYLGLVTILVIFFYYSACSYIRVLTKYDQ